jgi:hypothetical protein
MLKNYFLFAILLALLSGCATYHISTESLLQQFADAHPEKKVMHFFAGSSRFFIFFSTAVQGNDLRTIAVLDKNEKAYKLPISNTTSVRITRENGKKVTFYFNTLLLKDSTITGSKTHFFNAQISPIPFTEIKKIELQKH